MAKAFDIDTGGTLTTSLVSWWNFEGASTDEFSNNDGSDTAISYSSGNGKILQGAGFNGSTSKIQTPNDIAWTQLSISFWFNMNSFSGDAYIFAKTKASVAANADLEIECGLLNSGNDFYLGTRNSGGQINSTTYAKSNLSNSTWYHFVGILDETGDVTRIYINNSNVASNVSATGTHNDLTAGVSFGARGDSAGGIFNGAMDLVGVWTKVLSAQEITDLYNGGVGNAYRTPVVSSFPRSPIINQALARASFY